MHQLEIRRLLFFGTVQERGDCAGNPVCSEAANNYQLNLIEALVQCGVQETRVLTLLPLASFPRGPMVSRARSLHLSEGLSLRQVPFVNIGPLKPLTAFIAFVVAILAGWIKKRWRPDAVLIYNPVLRYALPAVLAAWLWRVPCVMIVADLNPATPWTLAPSIVEQLRTRLRIRALRYFDGLIVLSSHVIHDYIQNKPMLKVEGGISPTQDETPIAVPDGEHRTLMYAGNLNELSGAKLALDAFALLDDPKYRLWFTGRGPLQEEIERAAEKDARIHYWGFVERSTYLSLAAQATVLLNPRLDWPENRYNFPSKLLEYLASGRPVISTGTSDLEVEYGDKAFLLHEQTPQALAQLIEDVCGKEQAELDAFGEQARAYMLTNKTWAAQGQRVYQFLTSLAEIRRAR